MPRSRSLAALLCFAVACTASTTSAPHAGPEDFLEDLHAPPDEATLCELHWEESSVADVLAVLGTPSATRGDRSGPTFDYLYDRDAFDDVMLTILFSGETFTDAQLSNLSFPRCWSDDIEALRRKKLAELEAQESSSP